MSNNANQRWNNLINDVRTRNTALRQALRMCRRDLNRARNPTAGTGSTQGGGKRKKKSRKMKGGFMTLTADYVRDYFDHFAENRTEIEIEIEGSRRKLLYTKFTS